MAYRLGEYVVYGELYNRSNYSTHGNIALRGAMPEEDTVLRLELTGNCDKDLRGRHFRFMPAEDDSGGPVYHPEDHPTFQMRQIGPTGEMTAQGWVKVMPCSVEEFMRRAELGEAPPTAWKRRLYLEWYGQNGRVVIEMADAVVGECVREPKRGQEADDEGDWVALPNLALPPDLDQSCPSAGPDITIITRDGNETHIEKWTPADCHGDNDDNPVQDTPLQRQLDAESSAIDRSLGSSVYDNFPDDDGIREMELIDECMEHGELQPVFMMLEDAGKLAPDADLNDAQVETELKGLLSQLAMIGFTLDVCEHFAPRDCYRLLRDRILLEPHAYPELIGTGWVTHISTWEYCKECEAEMERESEHLPDCPF